LRPRFRKALVVWWDKEPSNKWYPAASRTTYGMFTVSACRGQRGQEEWSQICYPVAQAARLHKAGLPLTEVESSPVYLWAVFTAKPRTDGRAGVFYSQRLARLAAWWLAARLNLGLVK
jgi:hypothetical protein